MAHAKAVHRPLKATLKGADVKQFQVGINRTARHWKLEFLEVDVDGQLGPATANSAQHLLFAMGAYGHVMQRARKHDFSEYAQRLLRGTRGRDKRMGILSVKRRPALRKWRKNANPLRERAFRVAQNLVGVMEKGGNNTGPMVDKIIESNGGYIGEPWCGDFVAFCYRLAGSKAVARAWASVSLLGSVLGLTTTSSPEQGDIVRYSFDHTGLFDEWDTDGYFFAIEGNTGSVGAVSDSATGGDGVYRKRRHISQVSNFRHVTR